MVPIRMTKRAGQQRVISQEARTAIRPFLFLMMPVALQAATPASPVAVETGVNARLIETYGKLPLTFEANQGQTGDQVKFLSRGPGYTLFLTPTEAVLSLQARSNTPKQRSLQRERAGVRGKGSDSTSTVSTALRMQLVGSNPKPHVSGVDALPGKVNYFRGNDPKEWRTNVPTYAKVKYEQVYPGIDLVYYGKQRQLKHDFIIAPRADPKTIRLAFSGTNKLAIDPRGDLLVQVAGGQVRLAQPVIYQEIDGKRREIDFPTTPGAYDTVLNDAGAIGVPDAFVTKLNASGSALLYSTYLGGAATDEGTSIVVDGSGDAYVTGWTHSTNFPTSPGAFDPNNTGTNPTDGFVTKLNAAGTVLLYSTFLGGTSDECDVFNSTGCHIAIDSLGNAYVTGPTQSSDFPTTAEALDTTHNGNADAFLTQFNVSGTGLVYSTFLGSTSSDISNGIALDTFGNVYLAGTTQQGFSPPFFPTTPGAYDTSFNGSWDAFVAKISDTTPPPGTDLSVTKSDAPDPVSVGKDLVYTITVKNAGPLTATGVTLTDTLPTSVSFVSASGGCTRVGTLPGDATQGRQSMETPDGQAYRERRCRKQGHGERHAARSQRSQ